MINWASLKEIGVIKSVYRGNDPFQWIIIDFFLHPGCCEQLADFSRVTGNKDPYRKSSRSSVRHKINGLPKTEIQKAFFEELHSEKFLLFLKKITGIDSLHPDRRLRGAGIHETHNGGFLKVHTDFNRLPGTGKHRALNLMLYLNPVWKEEWGGFLEIWPESLDKRAHNIMPIINRMVLFRCSEKSFHGHPVPLKMPAGVTRKSLAVYYYEDWPEGVAPRPNTHYVKTPQELNHGKSAGTTSGGPVVEAVLPESRWRYPKRK